MLSCCHFSASKIFFSALFFFADPVMSYLQRGFSSFQYMLQLFFHKGQTVSFSLLLTQDLLRYVAGSYCLPVLYPLSLYEILPDSLHCLSWHKDRSPSFTNIETSPLRSISVDLYQKYLWGFFRVNLTWCWVSWSVLRVCHSAETLESCTQGSSSERKNSDCSQSEFGTFDARSLKL